MPEQLEQSNNPYLTKVRSTLLFETENPERPAELRKLAVNLLEWLDVQEQAIDKGTYKLATLSSECGGEGRLLRDTPSDEIFASWGWSAERIRDHKCTWVAMCADLGFTAALPPLPPAVPYHREDIPPVVAIENEFTD